MGSPHSTHDNNRSRKDTMEHPRPIPTPDLIQGLADGCGGTITECAALPDGSGFAIMSMPLPKDHWSCIKNEMYETPPMPFRMGSADHVSFGFERSTDAPLDPLDRGIVHGLTT